MNQPAQRVSVFLLLIAFAAAAPAKSAGHYIRATPAGELEHSVARQWNEELLNAIRNDFARPTIHARNLYHVSAAMWDAWAAYTPDSSGVIHD